MQEAIGCLLRSVQVTTISTLARECGLRQRAGSFAGQDRAHRRRMRWEVIARSGEGTAWRSVRLHAELLVARRSFIQAYWVSLCKYIGLHKNWITQAYQQVGVDGVGETRLLRMQALRALCKQSTLRTKFHTEQTKVESKNSCCFPMTSSRMSENQLRATR